MKKKRKLTRGEAAKLFDGLSAREQAAAEAHLRTDAGNAERMARNAAMLANMRAKKNPKKRGKLKGAAKAAFLARMAKGRERGKNPATRSARPVLYKITAKGTGPKMHFDGTKFSQRAAVKLFSTAERAQRFALDLIKRYPMLRKYRIAVETNF